MRFIEEKFRKLAPIDKNTDILWLLYLSGETDVIADATFSS
jgi:hypothetical protein